MKKILILSNHFITLYAFRKELISTLISEGNEVYLSLPESVDNKYFEDLGCKIIKTKIDRRGMNPIKDLKLLSFYKTMIPALAPDIVLSYTVKPNIYGAMACTKKIPFIANITGIGTAMSNNGPLQKLLISMYKFAFKNVRTVFFQNSANLALFKRLGIVKDNAVLIPGSGVNLTQHCFEPYPVTDKTTFLFVGRLMKDKGIEELVKAATGVKSRNPNVEFIAIGFCEDEYKAEFEKLNSYGAVKAIGHQQDVHSFMKDAHAIVIPSYHEGMSNVALEGAACGRPIIASRIPGCIETFDEGKSGIGFEPHDAASLESALERFLTLSYETRKEMGKCAHEKMVQQFDRQIVVNRYLSEINK